ncbi:hypothetical protein D7Y13_24085 [Corallococcus praedator]|uniref:Lipoprotein n=1 Tax=Corallococcus praedator TaxID=2316724 RepID=A0ABX9QFX0_9BACT|nr:hypothetical protein D7X75_30165 [Corallococcus sp. CA031C]RKI02634.1 hypothetical protein D7Y13_24085 [Corallococcus praedator]
MRAAIIAGLMAVGMLAGCGGTEGDVGGPPELETRTDELPVCGPSGYEITYYAEPERLTYVGTIMCDCGSGIFAYGSRSPYFVRVSTGSCSG